MNCGYTESSKEQNNLHDKAINPIINKAIFILY